MRQKEQLNRVWMRHKVHQGKVRGIPKERGQLGTEEADVRGQVLSFSPVRQKIHTRRDWREGIQDNTDAAFRGWEKAEYQMPPSESGPVHLKLTQCDMSIYLNKTWGEIKYRYFLFIRCNQYNIINIVSQCDVLWNKIKKYQFVEMERKMLGVGRRGKMGVNI